MIIVRLISGLGNQLFQYSFARRIALERNVPLKLDTSFYDSQDLRAYQLDYFNIKAEVISQEALSKALRTNWFWMARKGWYGTQRLLPYYKKRIVREKEKFCYDPNMTETSKITYFNGYWQHYRYHQSHEAIVRNELTLKSQYLSKISKLLTEIDSSDSVSLHIRRGDYISDPRANERFGILPLDYYQDALKFIRQRINTPTVYVFSDDTEWVQNHLKLDSPLHFITIEDEARDVLELALMSRCQHNIIANSTFSWWGAYLNNNPHKIVIAPKQWSSDAVINQTMKIQHPDWILL